MLHVLFYTKILTYFSVHVIFSLNLNTFPHILSYIDAFCNRKALPFLMFLTFLFLIFNNSPHSTYANNFSIVSFDVIRPLRRVCDNKVLQNF